MSKPMVELSVTNFHFVEPGLIKHVLLVWMGFKFRPKSWLPNYVLLYFLLNGEYYKDWEHVLGTFIYIGLTHLSKTQWNVW